MVSLFVAQYAERKAREKREKEAEEIAAKAAKEVGLGLEGAGLVTARPSMQS